MTGYAVAQQAPHALFGRGQGDRDSLHLDPGLRHLPPVLLGLGHRVLVA